MTRNADEYWIPDHVAGDRVRDFNIYNYHVDNGDVPRALYALRSGPGPETFWSPYNGGHWIVTRACTIEAVINDADRFSNRYIGVPKELNPERIFRPFQMDPPGHLPYRHLLAQAFSPRALDILKKDARQLTVDLIEGFRHRGECEFVSEFAQHMPIGLFLSIVGLPMSDRAPLLAIAEKIARPKQAEERMAGYSALDRYIEKLIDARQGSGGSDIVSQFCTANIEGKPLSRDELIGMIALLMIAGLDTVAGMLGFFARHLSLYPQQRQILQAHPELIPHAVEELLRRYSHVNLTRQVRHDLELDGALMREGDLIVAPLALSSLDEARFPNPLDVDFHRPREQLHLAFGGAPHRCLGSLLARNELKIFLEEWLTRIPEFGIQPGVELEARTRVTAVLPSLPLVWPVDYQTDPTPSRH